MFLGGFLFLIGLVIGSFINSFLWRYQEKKTYKGRSMCPVCDHKIFWYDNIPVLSWFLLSGKCRYCKKSISVQYPVVELMTGVLFVLVGIYSKAGMEISKYLREISNFEFRISSQELILNIIILGITLFITGLLVAISVYDYKTKEIPNGFNLTFALASLLYLLVSNMALDPLILDLHNTLYNILTACFAFAFFWSFVYFSKETWMGGGDAKFAFGMGLLLGPMATFLAILLASVIGSIYGLSAIGLSKSKIRNSKLIQNSKLSNSKLTRNSKSEIRNLSSEIPFGPFLALGTYISLLFAPQIIDFYVKIVLGL